VLREGKMEKEIAIIQHYAKEFEKLEQNERYLFEQINTLSNDTVEQLLKEFAPVDFQPVNLLRLEILDNLKEGKSASPSLISEIQQRIINKDLQYFKKYGERIKDGLQKYPEKKKSPFVNWKKTFSIFYPFFYTLQIKKETKNALDTISSELIKEIDLDQYVSHYVSFDGPQNYGAPYCWIALFPKTKISHTKSYQLFLRILGDELESGIQVGWDIKDKSSISIETFSKINEAIAKLNSVKETVKQKNNSLINYWKFAPGENGIFWEEFYNKGIMAIGWDHLRDLNEYTTDSLAEELDVVDVSRSNNLLSIENFRDAAIGDIVIANKGRKRVLGIGVIAGEYLLDDSREYYKHTRRVIWSINKQVDFDKSVFRPDTFSPTKLWPEIKRKYIDSDPELKGVIDKLEEGLPIQPTDGDLVQPDNYWWLNANPKIWSISSFNEGDIQTYTSHNDKGNKRRIYRYFEEVKPGDIVIGYESSPVKQIKAIFEITEGLHHDKDEGDVISFKIKETINNYINWDDLKDTKGLEKCEVFANNQGSLFKLAPEEFEIIRDLIDELKIARDKELEETKIRVYSFADDPERPFLEKSEVEEIINSLEIRKNIVLQGPPGVGKTFISKKIAYEMMKQTDDIRIKMIQFHQSYSYEDFIQGIRPSEKSFKIKNGVFYEFCKRAELDPEKKYFFIIDEINRGNLSKIFGELLLLIEPDKRGKYSVPLTYSERDDEYFSVPENLYIIGRCHEIDSNFSG